jgi:hypothetical protein
MPTTDLTLDHQVIEDTRATRRYFRKWERITAHLGRVAAEERASGQLSDLEVEALARSLVALTLTFRALALKYHFAGAAREAGTLTFDRVESGFPVAAEIMEMAADATQAERHLQGMPSVEALKDEMVRVILSERQVPTKLQYALSQRLYYEELRKGGLFWARNDPEAVWIGNVEGSDRRLYLLRWSVYETTDNLPVIYLMTVEDTGRGGAGQGRRRAGPWCSGTSRRSRWAGSRSSHRPRATTRILRPPIPSGCAASGSGRFFPAPSPPRAPSAKSWPRLARRGRGWALVWTEEDLVSERVEEVQGRLVRRPRRPSLALAEPKDQASAPPPAHSLPARPTRRLAELDPPPSA